MKSNQHAITQRDLWKYFEEVLRPHIGFIINISHEKLTELQYTDKPYPENVFTGVEKITLIYRVKGEEK